MSGNHNLYCSGNQPDIVQRLRDADWNDNNELFSMAADTIEFLRQQLAKRPRIDEPMLKGATDTAAMIVNELRQQLAECQKELHDEMNRYDAVQTALTECERERDELVFALKYIQSQTHLGHIHDTASAALAKVGADKTGEKG